MAGWGDDPVLDELRGLLAAGWTPVRVESTRASDTVTVANGDETRALVSDHIAFHRFVEGLLEENPKLAPRR